MILLMISRNEKTCFNVPIAKEYILLRRKRQQWLPIVHYVLSDSMKARELDNWLNVLNKFEVVKTVDRWHTIEIKGKMRRERIIECSDGLETVIIKVRNGNVLKPIFKDDIDED